MEEKKESTQNNSEEIKLLIFQPEQMVNEIEKLKAELSSVQMNNGYLSMINTDLTIEIEHLRKRSLKSIVQEFLLRILGGLWEEGK